MERPAPPGTIRLYYSAPDAETFEKIRAGAIEDRDTFYLRSVVTGQVDVIERVGVPLSDRPAVRTRELVEKQMHADEWRPWIRFAVYVPPHVNLGAPLATERPTSGGRRGWRRGAGQKPRGSGHFSDPTLYVPTDERWYVVPSETLRRAGVEVRAID